MAQWSPVPARPAAIPAGTELRLHRLLSLPEAPFAALAAPCGEGQLLAGLTAGSRAIRYGIEPHRPAARQAATHFARILICDVEDARVTHGEVSLLVLGTATSFRGARAARDQRNVGLAPRLRAALPWLCPGGVLLALLAPDELTPSTIKLLSARCEAVTAYRLSSSITGALVVAGVKRADATFDRAVRDVLAEARAGRAPALSSPPGTYAVPAGRRLSVFRSILLDPDVLESEVQSSSVWSAFWQAQLARRAQRQLRPPLPLHRGHLGLLLAAGECDGILGEGEDRHLVRGIVRKREIVLSESDDNGRQTTRTRDVFRVVVKLLFPDGTLRVIGDQAPAVNPESESADTVDDLDEALGVAPATIESADDTVEINALTGRRRRAFDL